MIILTDVTMRALNIAYNIHSGQKDKGGNSYIYHPVKIAEQMDSEEETAAALLHDVMEDSLVTDETLKVFRIPDSVVAAVKLLTHDKDTDYMEYIKKIKGNPLASKVKLADLKHNSDITRIPNPDEWDLKRLEKYKEAIKILEE